MAVQKRYKSAMETKLAQLWHQGYTVFERWELLAWYDKERLTNVVWRDIQETWEDIYDLDGTEKTLQIIKCDDSKSPQTIVFLHKMRISSVSSLDQASK
ncbi:MAG: hypothetical protein QM500_04445 [Methylococcales bacterium]